MKYGLIGKTLKHSISPEIHKHFGLNYELLELENEEAVENFLKEKKFLGVNVTIPYKETVIKFLDEITEDAKNIGAVNTIKNEKGKLIGSNTDIDGMRFAIHHAGIELKNKNVLILGSGGTSKTAAVLAKSEDAKSVTTVSRTGECNYQNVATKQETEVIINTTPVGMWPNIEDIPVCIAKFSNVESVFDVIYNPFETELVQEAKKLSLKASNGLLMLVEQARRAEEIFKGKHIEQSHTLEICNKMAKDLKNIVLIGMAGVGKTSVGQELAKKLKRPFFDTDKMIEEKTGKSISQIFNEVGEVGFRQIESEIVFEVAKKTHSVIATGGGAVLNEENRETLQKNAVVVFLKRPLEKLATDGRPLSVSLPKIKKMFEERLPIYETFANIEIENDKTLKKVVKEILEKI